MLSDAPADDGRWLSERQAQHVLDTQVLLVAVRVLKVVAVSRAEARDLTIEATGVAVEATREAKANKRYTACISRSTEFVAGGCERARPAGGACLRHGLDPSYRV